MKIKEIFKKYDEKRFRSMEQECANWIEKSVTQYTYILWRRFL